MRQTELSLTKQERKAVAASRSKGASVKSTRIRCNSPYAAP